MIKIFPTIQIKELDAYTIENEPVASIDLMERASQALAKTISERWNTETPFTVFAGPGNNGGDALAVSRLLAQQGYRVEVYHFQGKLFLRWIAKKHLVVDHPRKNNLYRIDNFLRHSGKYLKNYDVSPVRKLFGERCR